MSERLLRLIALCSVLWYGGGFASTAHHAVEHRSHTSAQLHLTGADEESPARTPAPADDDADHDCEFCQLLGGARFLAEPASHFCDAPSRPEVLRTARQATSGVQMRESLRPRAPPFLQSA